MTWLNDHYDRMEQKWRDAEAKVKQLEAENKKLNNDLRLCAEGLIPHDLIQRSIVETYREKIKELEEENKKLNEHNKNIHEAASRMIEINFKMEAENKKLKEQLESLQVAHIDMKCEITGLSLTEDDLYMSLDVGRLICESAYDDLDDDDKKTREELQEKITCLESDSMNEVSQAEFDDMVQEKDDEIKQIKKKCMKSISKLAREKKDLKKYETMIHCVWSDLYWADKAGCEVSFKDVSASCDYYENEDFVKKEVVDDEEDESEEED